MVAQIIGNPFVPVKSNFSPAANLDPFERRDLAVKGLARLEPISALAEDLQVSRKFIYKQIEKADRALDSAFSPEEEDDRVLYRIPVTKHWIHQVALSAILDCHGSYRGVEDFLRNTLDYELSVGSIHNLVMAAVEKARLMNNQEDLSPIRVGAHDELPPQGGKRGVNHGQGDHPVLVGVDPFSTYCYLLVPEPSRDGVTWGVHLLELSERGLHPDYTVADAGKGLRAGQAQAWPTVPCRGDVFHAEREMGKMTTYLENRAYGRIGAREELERKMARARKKSQGQALSMKLASARVEETAALQLADDVRVLAEWMREDVLSLIGPEAQIRREMFDFIVQEMKIREPLAPQRLRPIRVALENQRDKLLAFAEDIDRQLIGIANEYQLPLEDVQSVFEMGRFAPVDPLYWQRESALWKRLGPLYRQVRLGVDRVLENTVRASSMIENLNSRLRCYFFLRREVGPEYLELLRFFLNHRRYPRSRKEARAGKSPAEILQATSLPDWIEQLGFMRFRKAA